MWQFRGSRELWRFLQQNNTCDEAATLVSSFFLISSLFSSEEAKSGLNSTLERDPKGVRCLSMICLMMPTYRKPTSHRRQLYKNSVCLTPFWVPNYCCLVKISSIFGHSYLWSIHKIVIFVYLTSLWLI